MRAVSSSSAESAPVKSLNKVESGDKKSSPVEAAQPHQVESAEATADEVSLSDEAMQASAASSEATAAAQDKSTKFENGHDNRRDHDKIEVAAPPTADEPEVVVVVVIRDDSSNAPVVEADANAESEAVNTDVNNDDAATQIATTNVRVVPKASGLIERETSIASSVASTVAASSTSTSASTASPMDELVGRLDKLTSRIERLVERVTRASDAQSAWSHRNIRRALRALQNGEQWVAQLKAFDKESGDKFADRLSNLLSLSILNKTYGGFAGSGEATTNDYASLISKTLGQSLDLAA